MRHGTESGLLLPPTRGCVIAMRLQDCCRVRAMRLQDCLDLSKHAAGAISLEIIAGQVEPRILGRVARRWHPSGEETLSGRLRGIRALAGYPY